MANIWFFFQNDTLTFYRIIFNKTIKFIDTITVVFWGLSVAVYFEMAKPEAPNGQKKGGVAVHHRCRSLFHTSQFRRCDHPRPLSGLYWGGACHLPPCHNVGRGGEGLVTQISLRYPPPMSGVPWFGSNCHFLWSISHPLGITQATHWELLLYYIQFSEML